jgi:cysteine-rich repeat protein
LVVCWGVDWIRTLWLIALAGFVACACASSPDEPEERCGDGEPTGAGSENALVFAESCDDGNTVSGDGCNASCSQVEPGWMCETFGEACVPRCGDGQVVGGEVCDTGLDMEDGYCRNCAEVVPGRCGDGVIDEPFEVCDDGNAVNVDGCSERCADETGFDCRGEPRECHASDLPPDVALQDLDEVGRAAFCDWLVGAFGGAGADSVCLVLGVPMYAVTVDDRVSCENRLLPMIGCGIGACTVAEVEADVALGSTNLCQRWGVESGCSGRALYGLIATCSATPNGDDTFCEPTCR